MLRGFKEFIMRGNIIDLAVALVMGLAFAALIDTVVSKLVEPILNAFSGGGVGGFGFHILSSNPQTYVDLAGIINALIVFVMTAAVVYFVIIVPMNKVIEMRGGGVEEEEVGDDVAVLREIRDLLSQQRG